MVKTFELLTNSAAGPRIPGVSLKGVSNNRTLHIGHVDGFLLNIREEIWFIDRNTPVGGHITVELNARFFFPKPPTAFHLIMKIQRDGLNVKAHLLTPTGVVSQHARVFYIKWPQ